MINTTYYTSPVGTIKISFTDDYITHLSFSTTKKTASISKKPLCLKTVEKALDGYFKTGTADFSDVDFSVQGSELQLAVWKGLLSVKSGKTVTYADIAKKIGKDTAVRAVASAVAKNPLLLIIPCHRVVRSDGTIGQYSGGEKIKKQLLEMEK